MPDARKPHRPNVRFGSKADIPRDAYIDKPISIPNFLQTVERLAKPLVVDREAV